MEWMLFLVQVYVVVMMMKMDAESRIHDRLTTVSPC